MRGRADRQIHRLPGGAAGADGRFDKSVALRDGLAALDVLAERHGGLPLLHVGLSSGGHLAGVLACQPHRLRPRGLLIGYAPLNANHRAHKYPPDKPDYPPVEKQDFYDDWPVGLTGFDRAIPRCPVFLAYALGDRSVPVQHALRRLEAFAPEPVGLHDLMPVEHQVDIADAGRGGVLGPASLSPGLFLPVI